MICLEIDIPKYSTINNLKTLTLRYHPQVDDCLFRTTYVVQNVWGLVSRTSPFQWLHFCLKHCQVWVFLSCTIKYSENEILKCLKLLVLSYQFSLFAYAIRFPKLHYFKYLLWVELMIKICCEFTHTHTILMLPKSILCFRVYIWNFRISTLIWSTQNYSMDFTSFTVWIMLLVGPFVLPFIRRRARLHHLLSKRG